MKEKISNKTFWSGLGIMTASLVGSFGLMAFSSGARTANLPPPRNQSLSVSQEKLVNKTIQTNDSSTDLDFSNDDSGNCIVNGFTRPSSISPGYNLVIPERHGGKKVVEIAKQAFSGSDEESKGGNKIVSVEIPSTITKIGDAAFKSCKNLAKVTFDSATLSDAPEGTIGGAVFYGCSNLTEISWPSNFKQIFKSTFNLCTSLKKITIPEGITLIGQFAFQWCTSLEAISLPSSVTTIDTSAFTSCESLKNISIPKGITRIGDYTFYGCRSLESVWIPNTVKSIGPHAFYQCNNLVNVFLPTSVVRFDDESFASCWRLSNFILMTESELDSDVTNHIFDNDNQSEIDVWVANENNASHFNNTGAKKVVTKKLEKSGDVFTFNTSERAVAGLTETGRSAENIVIPGNSKHILDYAFSECSPSLKSISIESEVVKLDQYALRGVPDSTEYIVNSTAMQETLQKEGISLDKITVRAGDFVIKGETTLINLTDRGSHEEKLVIPAKITTIAQNSMQNCTARKVIIANDSNITIDSAFSGNKPNTKYYVAENTNVKQQLIDANVNPTNIVVIAKRGDFLLTSDNKEMIALTKDGIKKPTIFVLASIVKIDEKAFNGWNFHHGNIIFQGDQINFEPKCFEGIPDETEYYANSTAMIATLGDVGVEPNHISIASGNFYLKNFNNQTTLTRLTTKGQSPGLKTLVVTPNVTAIGYDAFQGCSSKLKTINFESEKLNFDLDAFKSLPASVNFKVASKAVKDSLASLGINTKRINLVLPKSPIGAIIGITFGAICLSALGIGLGIGIPMRKQHKVNLLNAKLTNRRIDSLAKSNALAFKKVIEATGTLSKKVDQIRALRPTNQSENTPPQPSRSSPPEEM